MTTLYRKKRDLQKQAIIEVFNKRQQRFTNVIIPSGITVGVSGDPDFENGMALNGPLTFKTTTAPSVTDLRLYVVGTTLYFNGNDIASGGWTDDGTTVRLTTATDKVGIGTASPGTKLEIEVSDSENIGGLLIDFNETGNYNALEIDTESTNYYGAYVHGKYGVYAYQDVSGGQALRVDRNIAEAGSNPLASFVDEHTSNEQTTVYIRQDGTGDILTLNDGGTEVFTVLDGGNVGIGASSPSTNLHIQSTGDAAIFLEADTDNSGETDNAYIKFSQDNTAIQTILGTCGNSGKDPENNTYTGVLANSSLLGTTTAYPLQFGTNDNVRVTIESGGDVGIATTNPAYTADVNGTIHYSGATASSDKRFKKNVEQLTGSLDKVKKLRGVRFEWNEFINARRDGYKLNRQHFGVIAQELEVVLPELVDQWKLSDDCTDARAVQYERMIPVLIEAMKEQQEMIEGLQQRVSALEDS